MFVIGEFASATVHQRVNTPASVACPPSWYIDTKSEEKQSNRIVQDNFTLVGRCAESAFMQDIMQPTGLAHDVNGKALTARETKSEKDFNLNLKLHFRISHSWNLSTGDLYK